VENPKQFGKVEKGILNLFRASMFGFRIFHSLPICIDPTLAMLEAPPENAVRERSAGVGPGAAWWSRPGLVQWRNFGGLWS